MAHTKGIGAKRALQRMNKVDRDHTPGMVGIRFKRNTKRCVFLYWIVWCALHWICLSELTGKAASTYTVLRPFACPGSKNSIVCRSAATVSQQYSRDSDWYVLYCLCLTGGSTQHEKKRSNRERLGFNLSVSWHHPL